VQWDPAELCLLHDWNVIQVPDGRDLQQVAAAQRAARAVQGQPTAVVYRTVKGWQYGIQGRAAHGAGHRLCSEGFYRALGELTDLVGLPLPACEGRRRCEGDGEGEAVREECFWEALGLVREAMAQSAPLVEFLAGRLAVSRSRLDAHGRHPRPGAPRVEAAFEAAGRSGGAVPAELALTPGSTTTLRGELGRALGYLNRASGGALVTAAADLLGSTSVAAAAEGFPGGYWHATGNPGARLLAAGGICEDAMTGILSGLSAFGRHLGVGASYGAFLAPLGHVAARLHAIGAQARALTFGDPCRPLILVCAHAGLKTGEDGPTHADPQALQLLQENFPRGLAITLTPWEPQEIWPLLCAALARRPALIAVFVTRPPEPVLDRERLGLAPPEAAASGVYVLRRPRGSGDGTVILQESAVTYAFVQEALPRLLQDGLDPWVYAVASAELFDLLPPEEQRRILPEARSLEAIGITGFTLPTMYRWIRSETGRARTLHPFRQGHYPGSGPGERVLAEAGLDGPSQYRAVRDYLGALVT
jgi:transketolase